MAETQAQGPLSDITVVDLTRVLSGPFCTQWLGDLGARVIKVEPPQGDEVRLWGPPFDASGTASYFLGLNRSKEGIALDLRSEEGQEVLFKLLENADVLFENFKPGQLKKWGLGYEETLKERFPRLIYARITGFGEDGPLGGFPGYDAVVQAMAGWMSINGTPESGPVRLGVPMVDMGTGLTAAIGILSAIHERERSGLGQAIETSLYDTAVSLLFPYAPNWFLGGKRPKPIGSAHPNIAPYDRFPTKTCDVFLGVGNDRQFGMLCEKLNATQLPEDPRFQSNGLRNENKAALREALESLLAEHDGEALAMELMALGVPAGPVLEVPEVVDHPHTAHRDMIVEREGYKGIGNPIKLSRTPAQPRNRPPRHGEHTRQLLGELGYSVEQIEAMLQAGAALDDGVKSAAE